MALIDFTGRLFALNPGTGNLLPNTPDRRLAVNGAKIDRLDLAPTRQPELYEVVAHVGASVYRSIPDAYPKASALFNELVEASR